MASKGISICYDNFLAGKYIVFREVGAILQLTQSYHMLELAEALWSKVKQQHRCNTFIACCDEEALGQRVGVLEELTTLDNNH